jgi:hypothetical protein
MPQVTVYLDDDAIARAKTCAAAARLSLSACVGKLVKEQSPELDANGYPLGFFAEIRDNSAIWQDFPSLKDIRAEMGKDRPRERL